MRKVFYLLIVAAILFSCQTVGEYDSKNKTTIKIGVFNRNGDSPFCIYDAVEALRIDPAMEIEIIGASDIMSERLEEFDVVLFPGGGGKSETNSLGERGIKRIQQYVIGSGKGVVGICAGAYILTNTPNYPSLHLSGGEAIDIEHDHRGNGLVKFSLTDEGKKILPELANRKISFCQYYEGPVLVASNKTDSLKYKSLATMLSDVHLIEGTPANMTNNRPFIITSTPGKGRTCSFVGHPECTPGMRWLIPRMVRWTAKKELISYSSDVVRPGIHTKEILYTDELKKEYHQLYDDLLTTPKKKIYAINRLVEIQGWSAKKWIPGMLRDDNPEVRKAAAVAVVQLERTDAIADIEEALIIEDDNDVKVLLASELKKLKAIVNIN
ncbi:MAG: BPL-N domain-containing protein [Bacteroidota bacterium]|nr:BPL-N domain-containing protein [Bacteroidota bacterium]